MSKTACINVRMEPAIKEKAEKEIETLKSEISSLKAQLGITTR